MDIRSVDAGRARPAAHPEYFDGQVAMQAIYEHEIGAVREVLGERFDAVYAEGAQRRFEHVVAELLGRSA